MANWQSVFLYYEPEKFCKLCDAKVDIYKWPDSMAMNDSATGCLKCLYKWFEHRNPASEAKPQEYHNRKPVNLMTPTEKDEFIEEILKALEGK